MQGNKMEKFKKQMDNLDKKLKEVSNIYEDGQIKVSKTDEEINIIIEKIILEIKSIFIKELIGSKFDSIQSVKKQIQKFIISQIDQNAQFVRKKILDIIQLLQYEDLSKKSEPKLDIKNIKALGINIEDIKLSDIVTYSNNLTTELRKEIIYQKVKQVYNNGQNVQTLLRQEGMSRNQTLNYSGTLSKYIGSLKGIKNEK
jgi:hypothetical protein